MIIHGLATGLDQKDILVPHDLIDHHVYLAVGQTASCGLTEFYAKCLGDFQRQLFVG
jgi:hypothetical protein